MSQISFSDVEYGLQAQTNSARNLSGGDGCGDSLDTTDGADRTRFYPKAGNGRRPYAFETMLRIHVHFMLQ